MWCGLGERHVGDIVYETEAAAAQPRWHAAIRVVTACAAHGGSSVAAVEVLESWMVEALALRPAAAAVSVSAIDRDGLRDRGVDAHIGTMCRFKGMECQRIALAAVSGGHVPGAMGTGPETYRSRPLSDGDEAGTLAGVRGSDSSAGRPCHQLPRQREQVPVVLAVADR